MRKSLVLFLSLLLIVGLFGCAAQPGTPEEPTEKSSSETSDTQLSENTEPDNTPPIQSPEEEEPESDSPPLEYLIFKSKEEMEIFFQSDSKTDEEFQKYLQDNSRRLGWIESKEQIQDLKSQLADVPFPILLQADLTDITFNFESKNIYIRYVLHADKGSTTQEVIAFDYYFDKNRQENISSGKDLTDTAQIQSFRASGTYAPYGILNCTGTIHGFEMVCGYKQDNAEGKTELRTEEILAREPYVQKILQERLTIGTFVP